MNEHRRLKQLKYIAFIFVLAIWGFIGWTPSVNAPFKPHQPAGLASGNVIETNSEADFDNGTYSDTQYDTDHLELDGTGITNGTGTWTSEVFSFQAPTDFNSIAWTAAFPYFKEIPNDGGIETQYDDGNFDASDAVLLLHMNEASWNGTADEVLDSSGTGNHGTANGDADTRTDGYFNRGGDLDGTGDYIVVDHDASLNMGTDDEVTVAGWFYFDTDFGNTFLVTKGNNGVPFVDLEWRLLTLDNGTFGFFDAPFFQISSNGTAASIQAFSNNALAGLQDTWVFLAASYDGATLRLYVNDTLVSSPAGAVSIFEGTSDVGVGATQIGSFPLDGRMDEVAVFDRGLTPAEIDDLYQRGALRLKYQVRSCDDPVCAGETFTGPDGTAGTFYSEEANSSIGFPNIDLAALPKNKYFQYEATLETDDGVDTPELQDVTINFSQSGSPTERRFPENLSFNIVNGPECVTDREVFVEASGDNVREIIVSENSRFLNAEWEFFTEPFLKSITLPEGDGMKTLYALFRSDSADKSDVLTTAVRLDETTQCKPVDEPSLPDPILHEEDFMQPEEAAPAAPPLCPVDCGNFSYHVYLVNPDGSERHMGSEFAMIEPLEGNQTRIRFEDKGEDFDFDDVWLRVNSVDCTQIIASVERVDANQSHEIRMRLFDNDAPKADFTLFQDSRTAVFRTTIIRPEMFDTYCSNETISISPLATTPPPEPETTTPAPQAPITSSCASATEFTTFLESGTISDEVRALQELLQCLGHFPSDINPTAIYGPVTIEAVESFQISEGIEPLGIVGPSTRAALNRF